ncbi:MAG: DUF4397 domain-containing protein [Fimbriimonadaceae bacterium]|nr:DUF4397 domain-containing protein [Fimbriimonadaceae bacterium]
MGSRKHLNALLAVIGAGVLLACGGGGGGGASQSPTTVRVIQSVDGAPPVNVFLAGTLFAGNLVYPNSGQIETAPGNKPLSINLADPPGPIYDQTIDLPPGQIVTAIAVGAFTSVNVDLVADPRRAPSAGNVNFRVFHAAPLTQPVNISVYPAGGSPSAAVVSMTNVEQRAVTPLTSVAAGNYRVRVTGVTSGTQIADVPITLVAGRISYALVQGGPEGIVDTVVRLYEITP